MAVQIADGPFGGGNGPFEALFIVVTNTVSTTLAGRIVDQAGILGHRGQDEAHFPARDHVHAQAQCISVGQARQARTQAAADDLGEDPCLTST